MPRRMTEKALTAVIQEASMQGLSAQAVDGLVQAMGRGGHLQEPRSRSCRVSVMRDALAHACRSGRRVVRRWLQLRPRWRCPFMGKDASRTRRVLPSAMR
ncbi:hypothetical protein FF100_32105 [Methylobacterium terricola]|uniref:Uncharacterized protein n=1 Tax=Methylobacterium terricola TaxID=2583531 RepID=A0A5C4L7J0_9HYPH|nr:hypothetical protein FF100_32105 [Methylobacterium terricola]